MTIDERKRHALYERLDEVLEDEHADTLMALLPPVGWADVATKQDLHALESRMEAGFADLRTEMAELRAEVGISQAELRTELLTELHRGLRQQVWAILGVLVVALTISEALSRIG